MARLTNRYAAALLEFARSEGKLEDIYSQALLLTGEHPPREHPEPISEELAVFVKYILESDIQPVMQSFVEMAREELGILDVEVVSAVPLQEYQLVRLEERLIRLSGKRVDIRNTVDPTILGGLRIFAGDTVIDNSIKTQLNTMKKSVYRGVYFGQ